MRDRSQCSNQTGITVQVGRNTHPRPVDTEDDKAVVAITTVGHWYSLVSEYMTSEEFSHFSQMLINSGELHVKVSPDHPGKILISMPQATMWSGVTF